MEEVADVGSQQVGDLQPGEVSAAVELGPTRDVVVLFCQGPDGLEDVVWQDGHPDPHWARYRPARGFVVRAPNPADGRRNVITLTDEGRRHLKRLDVLIGEAEAELLAPLSPVERAELTRILKLIVAHHGSGESRQADR